MSSARSPCGSIKANPRPVRMRYLMRTGRGFALIDPHGDLAEDMLTYAMHLKVVKGERDILSRVHYLEPSYEQVFHYAPFKFKPATPIPEYYQEGARLAWLHTKSDRIGEIVQRKQGNVDFAGMARLQRNLINVFTAVGTPVDKHGKHLG